MFIVSTCWGVSQLATKGVTGKTSRWAFLFTPERHALVVDALKACGFQAAISPLHDMDVWDRPAIINYLKSWSGRRHGAKFFYEDDFDGIGFSYDDCLLNVETPHFVVWPVAQAKPKDKEAYSVTDDGLFCFTALPSPGDKKKPHFHAQVNLDYAHSRDTFLGKLGLPEECFYYWEPVNSWSGLLRYYAHMDSPDKAQYRPTDIQSIFGFDLSPIYRKGESEKINEFEYVYAIVDSSKGLTLKSLTDRLIASGHSRIALSVKGSWGYWSKIMKAQNDAYYACNPQKRPGDPNYAKTDWEPSDDDTSALGDFLCDLVNDV